MDIVQSSNRIVNSFPPLNNITPFTRVDGWSFLEVLEGLRYYVVNILVSEIDERNKIISEQMGEWFDNYVKDHANILNDIENYKNSSTEKIDNELAKWQGFFDDFMADVVARLEALNDQAMANLIRNKESKVFEALKEVFSPFIVATNYAKGDGVEDDTIGLQRAFDLAENKTLIIPVGNYKITKTLRVRKNTTVYAYGAHIKLSTVNTSGVLLMTNGNSDDQFTEYNGNGNITFIGGIWDAQAHLNAMNSSNGFAFGHAKNIRFIDVEIRNLSQGHAIELNALKNVRILNCRFMGWGAIALTSEAIQLDYASTAGFPAFGLPDGTPCEDVEISGCEFGASKELPAWGIAIGGHTANAGKPCRKIRILHNNMTVRSFAVVPYYWTNFLIQGNTMDGGGINARAVADSISDIAIIDNNILNCSNFAIGLRGATGGINCLEARIEGNLIDTNANGYSALLVDYAPFVQILGNRITRAGYQGIRVMNSPECNVESNTVRNPVKEGIAVTVTSHNSLVINNRVSGAGQTGIVVDCHNTRIAGNYIRGFSLEVELTAAGILIQNCTQTVVVDNVVRRAGDANKGTYGIAIKDTASYIYIMGNDLRGSGEQGQLADEGISSIKTAQNLV